MLKIGELNNSKTAILISFFSLVTSLIVLPLSFYLNLLQIKEITQNQSTRYINYTLSFNEKLNEGSNLGIMIAIDDNKPLLKENGGKFSTHDLDNFLGVYNQLSDVRDHSLVTDGLIEENFSDGLLRAYQNAEVRTYLEKIRLEDSSYFGGFDELANLFIR